MNSYRLDAHFPTSLDHLMEKNQHLLFLLSVVNVKANTELYIKSQASCMIQPQSDGFSLLYSVCAGHSYSASNLSSVGNEDLIKGLWKETQMTNMALTQ